MSQISHVQIGAAPGCANYVVDGMFPSLTADPR
jgi:hypothetical protein